MGRLIKLGEYTLEKENVVIDQIYVKKTGDKTFTTFAYYTLIDTDGKVRGNDMVEIGPFSNTYRTTLNNIFKTAVNGVAEKEYLNQ